MLRSRRTLVVATVVAAVALVGIVAVIGDSRTRHTTTPRSVDLGTSTTTTTSPTPDSALAGAPGAVLSSVAGSDVPLPALPTGPTIDVPSSLPRDCSLDVTNRLQSWIDASPDNSTLSLASNACYRVDGTLLFQNRKRLRVEGNGATVRAFTVGDRTRAQLRFRTSENITVQDLVVRGANPRAGASANGYVAHLEAQHAFDLDGVTGVLLFHVQAYDLYGDFVYVGARGKAPSRNVTITRSNFSRSGRQGISITAGIDVAIADNSIGGAPRSLFDLEANTTSTSIRHILFLRNVTGAAHNFWLANKGKDANIGDVEFIDNRMSAATGGLVFVYSTGESRRGPYTFEGNRLVANDVVTDEGSKGAFFFTNAKEVTIRDNTVAFSPGMTAIELRNTHGVTVAGNHFTGESTVLLPTEGSSDYHVTA